MRTILEFKSAGVAMKSCPITGDEYATMWRHNDDNGLAIEIRNNTREGIVMSIKSKNRDALLGGAN